MTRLFIITCQMMQYIAHTQFVKLTVCMILSLSIIQKIVKTKPFVQSVTQLWLGIAGINFFNSMGCDARPSSQQACGHQPTERLKTTSPLFIKISLVQNRKHAAAASRPEIHGTESQVTDRRQSLGQLVKCGNCQLDHAAAKFWLLLLLDYRKLT